MEYTLKPGMVDQTDVEPSKTSTEAQAYCATVISNLEGWKGWQLPCNKERFRPTIAQLEPRIRHMEQMDGINPPPPMDMPSWDSLVWRAARLHRRMPRGPLLVNGLFVMPPHITASAELLRGTVAAIGGVGPQSWAAFVQKEESLERDDLLTAAAQFLCFLAGRRGYKINSSFVLDDVCRLALDLSLDADANAGIYAGNAFQGIRPKPRGGVMAPPPPLPMKGCCGCCSCSCHNTTRDVAKPSVLKWMTNKYHEEKRANRTGVKARIARMFGKLAFWRRHGDETDSDTSSISTRSSSTFT
ncbi:hypothetical protein F4803DRAFT_31320 [Xylaria telfairii]|nr:hypothetical protein F4803DRAFT_31320 [Xylaria telfairii]